MRGCEPLPLPFCSLPKGDPDGAAGSDMTSPQKYLYFRIKTPLLSVENTSTFFSPSEYLV